MACKAGDKMAPKRTRGGCEAALDKYKVGAMLGQGSYALVKSVERKSDGEKFAMKLIDMELSDAGEVEHERKILTLLGQHRHIICLADSFVLPGTTAFVMELAEGGDVFDKISSDGPFSEADAADVVRQVTLGLAFIHQAGVVHRDLKPENLLIDSKGVIKLADFGLAEWCGRGAKPITEIAGSAAYMAPEVILADDGAGPPYTETADLFSLGCVLFSLLGAYPAFDPASKGDWDETMARVEKGKWSFSAFPDRWKAVSSEAKAVIRSLLEPKPSKRLTADSVLTNKWVSGVGVSMAPLPGSDVLLRDFNHGRRVWRQAAAAASVFVATPLAAAFSASSGGAKGTNKSKKGQHKDTRGRGGGPSAIALASKPLPPAVQEELRTVFASFDLDGDGSIDKHEMRHAIRALGAPPGEAERILEGCDIDGDGNVSFAEFTALVQPLHDNCGTRLRAAFDAFDLDGSGGIDRGELSAMLRKLGFAWQGAHVFDSADTDGDGKVDFDEFVACFGPAAAAVKGKTAAAAAKGKIKPGKGKAAPLAKGKGKAAPPPAKGKATPLPAKSKAAPPPVKFAKGKAAPLPAKGTAAPAKGKAKAPPTTRAKKARHR